MSIKYRYEIIGKANLAAFDQLNKRFNMANALVSTLKSRLLFLAGTAGIGRLAASAFQFNAQLQSAQRGIAATILYYNEQVNNFPQAMRLAGNALDALRQKARESSANFMELMGAYSSNASLLFNAGVKDLEKQLRLLSLIGEAVKSLGLGPEQYAQETRSLLTGERLQGAHVARAVGINTTELRKAWRDALDSGKIYEFLIPRLQQFSESQKIALTHWDLRWSNFKEAILTFTSNLTRPAFLKFSDAVALWTETIKSQGFKQRVDDILDASKYFLRGAVILTGVQGLIGLGSAIPKLAQWLGKGSALASLSYYFGPIGKGLIAGLSALSGLITKIIVPLGTIASVSWAWQKWADLQANNKQDDASRAKIEGLGNDVIYANRRIQDAVKSGKITPEFAKTLQKSLMGVMSIKVFDDAGSGLVGPFQRLRNQGEPILNTTKTGMAMLERFREIMQELVRSGVIDSGSFTHAQPGSRIAEKVSKFSIKSNDAGTGAGAYFGFASARGNARFDKAMSVIQKIEMHLRKFTSDSNQDRIADAVGDAVQGALEGAF